MQPVLATRPRQDWLGILGEAGVPAAPVNDIADLATSDQLHAIDMLRTLPGSELRVTGLPISFDRQRPHPRRAAPKLGEHGREIFDRPETPNA
jgi:formyl-CoA transferase